MYEDLDDALDRVSVVECDEMNIALSVIHDGLYPDDAGGAEHPHPTGWYGVCDDEGVIGYFPTERSACWFRLAVINTRINLGGLV